MRERTCYELRKYQKVRWASGPATAIKLKGSVDFDRMFRRIIIVFIILCLPLQGVVATAMPFCEHSGMGADSTQAQQGNALDHGRPMHHAHSAPAPSGHAEQGCGGSSPMRIACDNCGVCHIACATFVPVQHNTGGVTLAHVYQPGFTSSYSRVAPEQLLHPPRTSFA
jgi:hypothetical protein